MRDLKRKDSLERALKDAGLSERVTFLRLDVTDPASIEAAVKSVLAETGNTLDAVVHNAGIAVAGVLEDLPDAEIRRVMETNFFGVLALTRALCRRSARNATGALFSSRARLLSPGSRETRCIAPPNGRSKDGRSPSPTSSIRSASTSWSLSPAPIAPRYGTAPFGEALTQRLSPLAEKVAARRRPASGQHLARSEGGGGDNRQGAGSATSALPLSGRSLRQAGFFLRGKIPTKLIRRGTTRYLGLPLARW